MAVQCKRFDPCCGLVDLKIASLIIGYLQLSGVLALAVWMIIRILAVAASLSSGVLKIIGTGIAHNVIILLFAVCVYIVFVLLVFVIALLVGVHKRNRCLIMTYLIAYVIVLVLAVVGFSVFLHFNFFSEWFYSGLVGFALSIYFLVIIGSYYRSIGNRSRS